MTPPPTDQTSCPPDYTSQRGETSPIQSLETRSNVSNDDHTSVLSRSLPRSSADGVPPRTTDLHFQPDASGAPSCHGLNSNTRNTVTFPHLGYHHVHGATSAPEVLHDVLASSQQRKLSSQSSNTRLNPTNYVNVSRKSTPRKRLMFRSSASIKGNYTVDPYLHIPAALLSLNSVRGREDTTSAKKNLNLEVENGGIRVNLFLIGEIPRDDPTAILLRTRLDLKIRGSEGTTFPLIARIHTPNVLRPPFHLRAAGIDGYHSLHLPQSFHGLVTIVVSVGDLDMHISLSKGFHSNALILSETATARSYFFGELGGWSKEKQGWEGDKIEVSIEKGMIRLQILGEPNRDKLREARWRLGLRLNF